MWMDPGSSVRVHCADHSRVRILLHMFAKRTPHEEACFTASMEERAVRGKSWEGRVAYVLQTAVKNGE